MIRFYKQGISPLMPSTCRFLPTCSSYAMESYKAFGGPLGTHTTQSTSSCLYEFP